MQVKMKSFFFPFFIIILSMILIDGLWLGIMVKRFYVPNIGHLFGKSMAILPGVIFYILYAIALNVFVVLPALKNSTGYLPVLMMGMLFGMAAYGTYDLTNQAILKNWPWMVTIVDIVWGSCLTGVVSVISTFVTRYFW